MSKFGGYWALVPLVMSIVLGAYVTFKLEKDLIQNFYTTEKSEKNLNTSGLLNEQKSIQEEALDKHEEYDYNYD